LTRGLVELQDAGQVAKIGHRYHVTRREIAELTGLVLLTLACDPQ
jgi:hypothetical protein